MSTRIELEDTPWGRIAAVARLICLRIAAQHRATHVGPSGPDQADFRDALRPYVERELLRARIEEARRTAGLALTARVKELAAQLQALDFPEDWYL